jgi:hypothetical protein
MIVNLRARTCGFMLALSGLACNRSQIEVSTDRRSYTLGPGDSVANVRLTVRNRSAHPIYLQTVDGRVALLVLIRVDSTGRILVGADTASREIWSLFYYSRSNSAPDMGVFALGPDSTLSSTYTLPRGHYLTAVKFGEGPDKLDEHGVWVDRYSIH